MKLVMERFCRPGGPNPTPAPYFSHWASQQGEGGRVRAPQRTTRGGKDVPEEENRRDPRRRPPGCCAAQARRGASEATREEHRGGDAQATAEDACLGRAAGRALRQGTA